MNLPTTYSSIFWYCKLIHEFKETNIYFNWTTHKKRFKRKEINKYLKSKVKTLTEAILSAFPDPKNPAAIAIKLQDESVSKRFSSKTKRLSHNKTQINTKSSRKKSRSSRFLDQIRSPKNKSVYQEESGIRKMESFRVLRAIDRSDLSFRGVFVRLCCISLLHRQWNFCKQR